MFFVSVKSSDNLSGKLPVKFDNVCLLFMFVLNNV